MSEITYEDFCKLDIRVGEITQIEEVPKSKKLLKLKVNFGAEIGERTILAGIAGKCYVIVGQRVLAVVNLAPRAMMGIESHGMLLAGEDDSQTEDKKLWLASCGPVPPGTKIG